DLKEGLCREMKHAVGEFFGDYPLRSPAYPRIVSERATARLAGMIGASGRVLWGGEFDVRQRYVAPTLIDDPDDDSPAMTEEIFGPLLPVKTFRHIDEAIGYVNRRDKPLALYYFGDRREAERVLDRTSSGGACVNDTIVHLANGRLPFGGVGESGFGKYHGRSSFDLFSHMRPVVRSSRLIDLPLKYAPYRRLKLYRKLFR
ncbi:aldehyde dehydrogenase family protein, partial [Alistipes ihumii]